MSITPAVSIPRLSTFALALGSSLVGTALVGGVLLRVSDNVWWLAASGLLSLFLAGAWLGWRAGEPESLYGALLAVLYFGVMVSVIFGGELAEVLPDPLPGLGIGDSTFFFVSPLLMLMAAVAGSVAGGRASQRLRR